MKNIKFWVAELYLKKQFKKLSEDKSMTNLITLLKGNKTYIAAGLYALITFLEASGLVDSSLATELRNFLLALGLGTLRAGMKK